MADTLKYRGSFPINEQPGSPSIVIDGEGWHARRVYKGFYAALLAKKPAKGDTMSDLPGLEVETVAVNKLKAHMGEMIVTLEMPEGLHSFDGAEDLRVEVDWRETSVPLSDAFEAELDGYDESDTRTYSLIEDYLNAHTEAEKDTVEGLINAHAKKATLWKIINKRLKGITSVKRWYPVVTKISTSRVPPTTAACGYIQDPEVDSDDYPSGYEWLKTGDNRSKTGKHGKWERFEQWSGFDSIDTDLYPEAP